MSWLNGVIGQGIASQIGAVGAVNNQLPQSYNVPGATGFGQAPYGQRFEPIKYMIDGKGMNFNEFVNFIYPEDCAEKTMLILRLQRDD